VVPHRRTQNQSSVTSRCLMENHYGTVTHVLYSVIVLLWDCAALVVSDVGCA